MLKTLTSSSRSRSPRRSRTRSTSWLYGGTTGVVGDLSAAANPRGILGALLAQRPANVLGNATNGTPQTTNPATGSYWGEVIDTLYSVADANESPNALLHNSKLGRQYAKAVDSTGQPLAVPADVAALRRFTTNKIPSYTKGTMANRATDLFAGDFTQLLIGQRLDIMLQPLTELYAGEGKIGELVTARIDVALARAGAFAVFRALQGA